MLMHFFSTVLVHYRMLIINVGSIKVIFYDVIEKKKGIEDGEFRTAD